MCFISVSVLTCIEYIVFNMRIVHYAYQLVNGYNFGNGNL